VAEGLFLTEQQVDDWWACVEWLELQGNAEDEAIAGWMRVDPTTATYPNENIQRRVAAAMKRWRERK
jgi:hypothetical protein